MRTLALVAFLIGVSALGGAIGSLLGEPVYIAPSLRKLDPQLTQVVLGCLSLSYALSALATGFGAILRRRWVRSSYRILGLAVLFFILFFLYIAPIPMDAFTFVVGPVFFGLVAFAYWKGWRVIESNVPGLH